MIPAGGKAKPFAYLRNAPPAYECNHRPSASAPFPFFLPPDVARVHARHKGRQQPHARTHARTCVQRHAAGRAVYPQSIKAGCQHEYQRRGSLAGQQTCPPPRRGYSACTARQGCEYNPPPPSPPPWNRVVAALPALARFTVPRTSYARACFTVIVNTFALEIAGRHRGTYTAGVDFPGLRPATCRVLISNSERRSALRSPLHRGEGSVEEDFGGRRDLRGVGLRGYY